MLTLNVNVGEYVKIGENIEVTVISVFDKQARIGIIAPKSIAINRKEIYEKITNRSNVYKQPR